MKKKQKGGTPDFRDKLTNDMVSKVEEICKEQGHTPGKDLIKKQVNIVIDEYVEDWYEVSLEAIQLMDGGADFVTDEEIDDPDLVKEAKLRVIKCMYDEKPPGIHEHVAESVIQEMRNET
jgi:transcription elongation factor GreA-like protein